MPGEDVIEFKILEDGTVKIETPGISGANHLSADQLLSQIQEALGGATTVTPRTDRKVQTGVGVGLKIKTGGK